MGRRTTMSDIARRAGVSRVAVSYALNGRPGVSQAVRERILRIAAETGFNPSVPAQALHGAAAHAIGLVLSRPAPGLAVESFRRRLIGGVQAELAGRGFGLVLQFTGGPEEELDVYRRWHGERRVDGVIVCDLRVADPRPGALAALGLPAVILGPPDAPAAAPSGSGTRTGGLGTGGLGTGGLGTGELGTGELGCEAGGRGGGALAYFWSDPGDAVEKVVAHLARLGHRRVARVGGPAGLLHSVLRAERFAAACERAGLAHAVIPADRTGEAGAHVTRRVLSSSPRPTAIVYDNDVMAVAGLSVAGEMGVAVPRDLSLVAGDDSPLCQAVRPALTVLSRDVPAYGAQALRLLFEVIEGGGPRRVPAPAAVLVARGSTAAAPAGDPVRR